MWLVEAEVKLPYLQQIEHDPLHGFGIGSLRLIQTLDLLPTPVPGGSR